MFKKLYRDYIIISVMVVVITYSLVKTYAISDQVMIVIITTWLVLGGKWLADDLSDILEQLNNNEKLKKRRIFLDHLELSKILRENAYQDPFTKLTNKKYLMLQMEHILNSADSSNDSICVFIKCNSAHKEEIIQFSKHLSMLNTLMPKIIISYIEGGMFVAFLRYPIKHDLDELCYEIVQYLALKKIPHAMIAMNFSKNSFAESIITDGCNKLDKLSLQDEDNWQKNTEMFSSLKMDETNWELMLPKELTKENIILNMQPVYFYEANGTLLFHNEVFTRIKGINNETYLTSDILPIYKDAILDKLVLESVLDYMADHPDAMQRFAVNLSEDILRSDKHLNWIKNVIQEYAIFAHRLCLEFNTTIAFQNIKNINKLYNTLQKFNVQFGIDGFGKGISSFAQLNELPLGYIKLDGGLSRLIQDNLNNQLIIRSFIEMAHGLDMLALATAVETKEELQVLDRLYIDGVQGFFVGQPN
jgi:EAL domain-containing protein (putative c-di-GMP-specific phosphodiesterase class I)